MGSRQSTLTATDLTGLRGRVRFGEADILKLYERFKSLDRDRSGTLSAEELLGVPEFAMNPLASRLVTVLLQSATGENEEVNFRDYLEFLSVFHPRTPVEEKLRFALTVFDTSGDDGRVTGAELKEILRAMVGQHLQEAELDVIVQRTMESADADGDGRLSEDDLLETLHSTAIADLMTFASAQHLISSPK